MSDWSSLKMREQPDDNRNEFGLPSCYATSYVLATNEM